jgi:hypothetical protein
MQIYSDRWHGWLSWRTAGKNGADQNRRRDFVNKLRFTVGRAKRNVEASSCLDS